MVSMSVGIQLVGNPRRLLLPPPPRSPFPHNLTTSGTSRCHRTLRCRPKRPGRRRRSSTCASFLSFLRCFYLRVALGGGSGSVRRQRSTPPSFYSKRPCTRATVTPSTIRRQVPPQSPPSSLPRRAVTRFPRPRFTSSFSSLRSSAPTPRGWSRSGTHWRCGPPRHRRQLEGGHY